MRSLILILIFSLCPVIIQAQSPEHELADLYFSGGEYDKAISYYEKFYKESPEVFYLERYVTCLIETGNSKEAEKFLERHLKRNPKDYVTAVFLGKYYEKQEKKQEAQELYSTLIKAIGSDVNGYLQLSAEFRKNRMHELELETLLEGRKNLRDRYPFNIQIADAYGSLNKNNEMINEYIALIEISPNYKSTVQNLLIRYLRFENDEEDLVYEIAKTRLIEMVQNQPNNIIYTELLVWLYNHKGNFPAALIQAKALDRRLNRGGSDVLSIGLTSKNFNDYKTARAAFQYILDLGENSPNYYVAEKELLNTLFIEITKERSFTSGEITQAETAYEQAIQRVGKSGKTFNMLMEYAEILAFYAQKPQKALSLVDEIMALPQLPQLNLAQAKMLKADILVVDNNVWEASLLYMQIEKDFKQDIIGSEAKYKNARIYYYVGEFEFAQAQLDVLKASTSKLIANDAMNLSVTITDNYGLDSNFVAMSLFSSADLLIQQHKYEEAFSIYDSIAKEFPAHSLGDEMLMKKAEAMKKQGKWDEAIHYLEQIISQFPEDILADDALFQAAEIYESKIKNKEKAIDYYKSILFDYKGSLLSTEARKRFRELSGDAPKDMTLPN